MESTLTAGTVPLTRVQSSAKTPPTGRAIVDGPPYRISRLPKAAADKLARLIAAEENAKTIRQSVGEERNRVLRERGLVTQALSRLDAAREPPDSPVYQTQYAERERIERELAQLDERLKPLDAFNTINLRTIERALDALPDPIRLAPVPIIPDGATVETIRGEIAQLERQLAEVRAEPLSASERRAKVREWIAARAIVPSVNELGDIVVPVLPPTRTKFADAFVAQQDAKGNFPKVDGFIVNGDREDTLGIMLGLWPDIAEKAICRDLPDGISSDDRAQRISDLLAALLEAERIDVHLGERTAVPYRKNCDTRALLGIA